jgi:AraC-like DNA-binding protein
MAVGQQNYFRYFAEPAETAIWGLSVTAAGYTRVPKGARYPMGQHPLDRAFHWERGRVLDATQIVLIAGGRGRFETQTIGLREVQAGEAFVVLPGIWHRYEPYPESGWEESWLELRGATIDRLIQAGVFSAKEPVRSSALQSGMHEALESVHARSRAGSPGFDAGRAAAAYAVIASWQQANQPSRERNRTSRAVHEAEQYLAEHYAEQINIEQLARRLGVAYSHFRRAFSAQTGFSPWQYMLHLRLARAKRMIAGGEATLEEIAAQLNFNSASHLSLSFKQAFGVAPTHWRRALHFQQHAPPPPS